MKKLPVVSSDDVIKVLKRTGFEYTPKTGERSHTALYRIDAEGRKLLVIVPKRKELPTGTLVSILHQADLSRDNFIVLLK